MDNIIEVKNLVKKFGDFSAVNDISFTIPRGQIFAFLGPNGAGKSTTIKIMTTLLAKSSGTIKIAGYDIEHDQNKIRNCLGIVFQDPSLDDELTAYENMEIHARLYGLDRSDLKEKIKSLLEFVELWERQDKFVKTFSGGMKRRLEIARGFLHKPQVLFLDEPTQGLDPQTRNHIWSYVKKLNQEQGLTVFFTTHYIEEAEKSADYVAVIDAGKIVAAGTPADLITQTKKTNLEDAFLELTGHTIRDEEVGPMENMRNMVNARRR
ncbi:MAG: ATP-binding cassette domain-containing protein [Patescibacteria group bacterium]